MMAGVVPGAARKDDEKKKLLPVTPLGRYVKVLLELERVPVRRIDAMPMSPLPERATSHRSRTVTRREALCRIGNGFGMLAFAGLVGESLRDGAEPVARRRTPKLRPRAACTIQPRRSTSSSCS